MKHSSALVLCLMIWGLLLTCLSAQTKGELLEMRVVPASVDVTREEALVYLEMRFTSESEISMLSGTLTHADGGRIALRDTRESLAYHLTGDRRAGTWRCPLVIPAHASPGVWAAELSTNWAHYGGTRGLPFPAGAVHQLTVVNAGVVNRPPVFRGLSVDRETVDITSESQSIELTVAVEDEIGVDRVVVSTGIAGVRSAVMEGKDRIEGTAQSGVYRTSLVIPRFAPPGDHTLQCQAVETGQANLFPRGALSAEATAGLTVVNAGAVDTTPPTVVSLRLDRTAVDVTDHAQAVRVTLTAEDSETGLKSGQLLLAGTDTAVGPEQTFLYDADPPFETGQVTRSFTLTIPRHLRSGRCDFMVQLTDGADNTGAYGLGGTALPAEAQASIEIVNHAAPPEDAPPALVSCAVRPSMLEKAGLPGLVEIRARLTGGSDIRTVYAYRAVAPRAYSGTRLERVDGTARDGTWAGRVYFPAETASGEYFVYLIASDENGRGGSFGAPYLVPDVAGPYPPELPMPILITPGGQAADAYETWRRAHTGLEGPESVGEADPDGDGYPNAVEFLCGTDPLLSTGPGGRDPASDRLYWNTAALRLECAPSPGDPENATLGSGTDLRLMAWKSADLTAGSWLPVSPVIEGRKRSYPLDSPGALHPAQFLRLSAERE